MSNEHITGMRATVRTPRSPSPFDPRVLIATMDTQPHPTFPPAPMVVTDRHAALGCPLFLARVEAHAEWKACLQAAQAHLSAQCPLFFVTYPQNPVASPPYSSAKASYWFAKDAYSFAYLTFVNGFPSILPPFLAPRQQRNASGRSPPGQRATAWQVLENQ